MSRATTTAPVAVPPTGREIKPEWLRVDDCPKVFGLSRRTIYNLIEDKKIESRCIRSRGQVRGIRLINFDSLESYVKDATGEASQSPRAPKVTQTRKPKS